MAKIKRGILGGISGKVANLVGGSWKGIEYVRALPLSVANPRTAGQVAQRTSFSFGVQMSKILLSGIIKPLWDRFAQRMSGYNAFMSANVEFFVDFATTTWASIIASEGKMMATPITGADNTNGDPGVNILFDSDLLDNFQLITDISYGWCVNSTQGTVAVTITNEARDQGACTVVFAENNVTADNVHCYLSFRRVDGSIVSDSSYFLSVTPA